MAQTILNLVIRVVDDHWRVMPIGGTAMSSVTASAASSTTSLAITTKDVDIVLLEKSGGDSKIPPFEAVVKVAQGLSESIIYRKDDQDAIRLIVEVDEGPVAVEFVRGRNNSAGGYFVTRRVLETAASLAEERGRVLVIPPEVLAVLKAWAATDQEKLVKARKDPSGYHTSRAKQFHQDVGDIHAAILSAGLQPRPALVKGMLDACPKKRRIDVEAVLRKSGWQV